MIGAVLFDISCEFYFVMLGFIWMLVDSLYHIIKPLESPKENNSNSSKEICDFKNSLVGKSNQLIKKESHGKLQEEIEKKGFSSKIVLGILCEEGERVNPDTNYLSKPKAITTSKDDLLDRRLILKESLQNECDVPSQIFSSNHQKALTFMVVDDSFKKKSELKNNLLFSIRKITKSINYIPTSGKENSLSPTGQYSQANRKAIILKLKNLESSFLTRKRNINWSLYQSNKPQGKRIKLNNYQIIVLQETAHYIMNHSDIEVKSLFRGNFEEMEMLEYFDTYDDHSDLRIKLIQEDKKPNVIITELDSTDEAELSKKHKTQRKKKNKKKHRRNKLNIQKHESNSATFSSKQCFERLALFMRTNQGLTRSKMMLEIEKELKPIKDQISQLRDSMTDFVVVNHRTNEKGIKSSRMAVKLIDRTCQKQKSILTVSSASLQRLASLADTSNSFQEKSKPEITDIEPKKLSPLAEMYIKLSRQ